MADQATQEVGDVPGGSPESSVQLNVKTLDSQIHSFHVDKNMPVSVFKEKIASQIGVAVGQQRLIFRGKVLKDDHPLSEYHVENGDTLHLVTRHSQSQPSSGPNGGETSASNANSGQDPLSGSSRNRIGHISHSVVLGTFNVGDQAEGGVPDLNRVIGAVLNSIGMGNQAGGIPNMQLNSHVRAPQGNEAEGIQNDQATQNPQGDQSQPGVFSSQSFPQGVQMPLGPVVAVPSLTSPIPDSLHTLSEFMNRMEATLLQNGYRPNQAPNVSGELPPVNLPTDSRGLSTPEALVIVLQHAQRLIGERAVAALSLIAGRLEQEGSSNDLAIRRQIQTESAQVGLAMQHLGALLLELGRTMLTLRLGQSSAESSVNSGPAVYISPSGPNPIMVQPFPLQTNSLIGGPAAVPSNAGAFGPVGFANIPRHVNIHIHTVGARASNGEGTQGQLVGGTGSGFSGQSGAQATRNVTATTIPLQPAAVSASGLLQPGQLESTNVIEQSIGTDGGSNGSSQIKTTTSGSSETSTLHVQDRGDQKVLRECQKQCDNEDKGDVRRLKTEPCGSSSAPLGLGLGGLQPKRRSKQTKSQDQTSDAACSSNQNDQSMKSGQHVLQSLASLSSRRNDNTIPIPQSAQGGTGSVSCGPESGDGQFDVANPVSQVLESPAVNGLLTGISRQTGVGSPDVLRNMLQQFTQNPAMMNTVNQIAQQIDSQDLGSMLPGLGGGQGGSIDLSRIFQQMMPVVSQALGGASSVPQQVPGVARPSESALTSEVTTDIETSQIDLQQVVQRIENHGPPEVVFRSVVENVVQLLDSESGVEGIVNSLCDENGLAEEFMEMLQHDVSTRLEEDGV